MQSSDTNKKGTIDSDKAYLGKLLTDFWFCIPKFQRSYVWKSDQVNELFDDLDFARKNHPTSDYFLGSMVLRKREVVSPGNEGISYFEHDVLDGQQRLTTLLLLLAVIRDRTADQDLIDSCTGFLYQKKNKFKGVPERPRLKFDIRDDVGSFVKQFVIDAGGTKQTELLTLKKEESNTSISCMANAFEILIGKLEAQSPAAVSEFARFLFQRVLLIYVSADDLDDAFRLFTILNSRGLPLTNSDILKSENLGTIEREDPTGVDQAAKRWESIENKLGTEDFERLFSHIRTIYVKDKARENILKEFETKIYAKRPPLFKKGEETFKILETYSDIFLKLLWFEGTPEKVSNRFKNLVTVMNEGFPSTDWVPPLLEYYRTFHVTGLEEFLVRLDTKFGHDWITQKTPTERLNSMIEIVKAIQTTPSSAELLKNKSIFSIDKNNYMARLMGPIYDKSYCKYVLLKLEWMYSDHSNVFPEFKQISVEHVLPQTPDKQSGWWKAFDITEHKSLVHTMANLVLLSRRKNSQLSNADFKTKQDRYFALNISAFPSSMRVMKLSNWGKKELLAREKELLDQIRSNLK